MIAYFQPGSDKKLSRWDLDRRQMHYLSMGLDFDSAEFRSTDQSFSDAVTAYLKRLRSQKKYIRFWFSGGKDSRLVFDIALREKIYFDEIVMVKPMFFGPGVHIGSSAEIKSFAEPLMPLYQQVFPKTKISLLTITDEHFAELYRDPLWYKNTHHHYFTTGFHLDVFYTYINSKFNLLSTEHDCDLQGFEAPHIWFDQGWKFCYIDNQFNNTWPLSYRPIDQSTISAFLTEVVAQFEAMNYRPEKFQNTYTSRALKNLTTEYKSLDIEYEYPKYFSPVTQDKYWISCSGFKDYLINIMAVLYEPKIQSWHLWANNTDWDDVRQEILQDGILSKEFRFDV